MNKLKLLYIVSVFLSFNLSASEIDCESPAILVPGSQVLKTMKTISDNLYKDIATMKVNMDGEGKLSVFYEKGEPKLLKLTYTNSKGTVIIQKTFEELSKGVPLIYENKDKPGKAIILEKSDSFKNDKKFSFRLKVRTSYDPEKHSSFPIDFEADINTSKVSSNQKQFKNIILSPGVSFLSWDGTFKKVEFNN
jgi:hypothetical protein